MVALLIYRFQPDELFSTVFSMNFNVCMYCIALEIKTNLLIRSFPTSSKVSQEHITSK